MRWLHLAPEEDGRVWMLNLMKYKEVADYGDAGGPAISGREADDIYAPTDVLADLGATVPLFGDVTRQVADGVAWDRIAIVATRAGRRSSPCRSGTTSRSSTSTRRRAWRRPS